MSISKYEAATSLGVGSSCLAAIIADMIVQLRPFLDVKRLEAVIDRVAAEHRADVQSAEGLRNTDETVAALKALVNGG